MPLIALIIDALAFGAYYLQMQNSSYYTVGVVVQAVLTLILLIIAISYSGKRYGYRTIQNRVGHYRNFSLRYVIIFLSFLINAAVLFLYVLNITGTNSLIFQK